MTRVLVAMSGGVDSSVAAARLVAQGHEVVGATLKLWGGASDSGCCSLSDVTDARRVADRLGIEHFVFNMTDAFEERVVAPYVAAHGDARTPNPCVECNRHIKFAALLDRSRRLGFGALATGHHARVRRGGDGTVSLLRGADGAKDQSYVLSVLEQEALRDVVLPIGELQKDEVRRLARDAGLRVADKAESQDVCFIAGGRRGRTAFLAERLELRPGVVLHERSGEVLGEIAALELVTIGQRRGLPAGLGARHYVTSVDAAAREVRVGDAQDLLVSEVALTERTWTDRSLPAGTEVLVQASAHGDARPGVLVDGGVALVAPARRIAPGQVVALYRDEAVVGSGIAA